MYGDAGRYLMAAYEQLIAVSLEPLAHGPLAEERPRPAAAVVGHKAIDNLRRVGP